MLWPERRDKDPLFGTEAGPGVGVIDRITVDSYLEVPESYISPPLRPLIRLSRRLFPFIGGEGGIGAGSVRSRRACRSASSRTSTCSAKTCRRPSANEHKRRLRNLVKRALRELKGQTDFGAALAGLADDMLAISKCKDLVVNKGHYFGTDYFKEEPGLSDGDKRALIAFLKTF